MTTSQFKRILDEIQAEGCFFLTLTGGEPLLRKDFLEIYSHAKSKGFIITIFTNGQGFNKEIVDYLVKSPPLSIEITLNGITRSTYEGITQVKGSFSNVMKAIELAVEKKLPLKLKTNALKQNRHEIAKIKKWVENILSLRSERIYHFKFDPMVYPRLNGDKSPCKYRLSFKEHLEAIREDPDIWEECQTRLTSELSELPRERDFLYHCNSWMHKFFIDPYGRLKFCQFSERFSVDLQEISFKEGFYKVFPQVLNERFKTESKCRDCALRSICYVCPARAYLEIGDEEAPVPFYCQLAKETAEYKNMISKAAIYKAFSK
jgi:radical SAM protein with 4Fe4S-binding SPASM domain